MDLASILSALMARLNPTPAIQPVATASGHGAQFARHKDYEIVSQPGPRAPRPAHTFTSLEDFAAWLGREAAQSRWDPVATDVLVGQGQVAAVANAYAALPSGATCSLAYHPHWLAWRAVTREAMASGDLFEALRPLVDTFRPDTTADGRKIPAGPAILSALRNVAADDTAEGKRERDAGGMVRLVARTGKTVTAETPRDHWELTLPVFDAAPDLVVDVDALISWRYDKETSDLVFGVRMPLAPIAERKARDLVVGRLRELLPAFQVGAGMLALANERLD